MTLQLDADGVPPDGTPSIDVPRHSRALLALVAAGTVAAAPVAGTVLGLAGSGDGAHSAPVYLLAEASHDIGHNDWAFQRGFTGLVSWATTYVVLALAWLAVAIWMRGRRETRCETRHETLWLRTWSAALAAEFAAGALTVGAALYAQWTATSLGPVALRLTDACSPWWACVAALVVVARAERNAVAVRAAFAYGAVLTLMLTVPLPGPNLVKTLVLAATAAVPALLTPGRSDVPPSEPSRLLRSQWLRPDAAAAG
jgi:hypothetical protein